MKKNEKKKKETTLVKSNNPEHLGLYTVTGTAISLLMCQVT